jgi:hypothetical protein
LKGFTKSRLEPEESIQNSSLIQLEKLSAAADRSVIDEYSREGLLQTALLHFCCLELVIGDIILDELNTLDAQQLFSTLAEGTICLGVDLDLGSQMIAFPSDSPLRIKIPEKRQDASERREYSVISKLLMRLCVLVLASSLLACGGHMQTPPDKLDEMSRDDFMSAMRWSQYQVAASLMKPEYREDFLNTFNALKDLHIVDVRLIDLKTFQEDRRFETTIEMDYYLLPSITVKSFQFKQTWVFFEGEDQALQGFLIVTPFPEFP